MPSQRPIFAVLALGYCLCLGIFALLQAPRSRLNRYFAFYNFANAIYNAADFVMFVPHHSLGIWWIRIAGVGASLTIPFLMLFVFELMDVAHLPRFSRIARWSTGIGALFALLYLTPLIIKGARYDFHSEAYSLEVAGPLYSLFAGAFLSGLAVIVWALFSIHRTASRRQRERLNYVIAACSTGAVAFSTYLLSFFGHDWPLAYYSLQALVAFIFSYAIFKHDMIPFTVAFRRTILIVGIYVVIGIFAAPLLLLLHKGMGQNDSWNALFILIFVAGVLFSMGPLAYSRMVNYSALFQDRATSQVVHEFKTPLHAIQSAKEILDGELAKPVPDAAKVRDYMDMIQRNTERLEKFVSEILSTVKAGETPEAPARDAFELTQIAREAAAQFPPLAARLSLELGGPINILGDAEALRQVFANLLSNAAKFCPNGPITLRVCQSPAGVECSVEDRGAGIARADLERIFQPFVQTEGGKRLARGTGLGLAIAQRWVEAHRGKIWAESDGPGHGARFVFTLPFPAR